VVFKLTNDVFFFSPAQFPSSHIHPLLPHAHSHLFANDILFPTIFLFKLQNEFNSLQQFIPLPPQSMRLALTQANSIGERKNNKI